MRDDKGCDERKMMSEFCGRECMIGFLNKFKETLDIYTDKTMIDKVFK